MDYKMKYMGSKSRLVKYIKPIIELELTNREVYAEPFVGGFNMIAEIDAPCRYANDSNKYIIAMIDALSSGWVPQAYYTKDEYETYKSGQGDDHEIGYVGINCSYSGKWFGGFAGITTTKKGIRNYQIEAYANVSRQIKKLDDVILTAGSYLDMVIPDNSVIYCDPPYADTTGYGNKFNHGEFWEWARDKSASNVVLVSEYSAPDDFKCVWQKEMSSSLSANGKAGGNKTSIERLFKLA
jgi:DNA adenine methylase